MQSSSTVVPYLLVQQPIVMQGLLILYLVGMVLHGWLYLRSRALQGDRKLTIGTSEVIIRFAILGYKEYEYKCG